MQCAYVMRGDVQQWQVSGPSMFPTFTGRDDIVLVEAVSPILDRIEKGEVLQLSLHSPFHLTASCRGTLGSSHASTHQGSTVDARWY